MLNPHWLIHNSERKEIPINGVIQKLYAIWKILCSKNNYSGSDMDAFATGYILGVNSTLKEKYLDSVKEPKRDLRIQDSRLI